MAAADIAVLVVLFAALIGGSTYLAAAPLRREVARAVERQTELPRIANWWRGVVARAWMLGGAAIILLAAGGLAWANGIEAGGYAAMFGLVIASYLVQAAYLVRVIDRTIERASRP